MSQKPRPTRPGTPRRYRPGEFGVPQASSRLFASVPDAEKPAKSRDNRDSAFARTTKSARPLKTAGPRDTARRPGRSSNQGTVKTQAPSRGLFSVGGLTVSIQALAVLLISCLVALILIPMALQWTEQRRELRAVNAEVSASQQKIDQLQGQVDNWSDDDYIASQARSRLGYVQKGETQFSVADAPELEATAKAKPNYNPLLDEAIDRPWTLQLENDLKELDNPPAAAVATNE